MATPNPVAPQQESTPQSQALDQAIDSYHEACDAIVAWEQRRDAASAVITALLPAGSAYGGVQVSRPRRTLSPDLAAEKLTPTQYALICEYRPSAKLAKDRLSQAELDLIYTSTGKPFVRRWAG